MYRIIIPTMMKKHVHRCIESVKKYTTQEHTVDLITDGTTWAEAVNIGINKYPKDDIILMDDDVIVTSGWLDNIEEYKQHADIIGWTLKRLNNTIQFAGCFIYKDNDEKYYMNNWRDTFTELRSTPNTTTSLCYIKREVFDKIGLLDNDTYKEGCHYEDSDFCMRAIAADLKIAVAPEIVLHLETLTKKDFKNFKSRVAHNGHIFYEKLNKNEQWKKICKERGFIR